MELEDITEEQERLARKHKESMDNAIAMLMKIKDGQYFLNYLLEKTGVFKSYNGTAEQLAFFEGRRSIGTDLLELLQNHNKNNLSTLFQREE